MKCPKGHIVINTSIDGFVNQKNGCFKCNGNEPWTHRREEFKRICGKRNYILMMKIKRMKKKDPTNIEKFKPKMECPKGHIVINTPIDGFVYDEMAVLNVIVVNHGHIVVKNLREYVKNEPY